MRFHSLARRFVFAACTVALLGLAPFSLAEDKDAPEAAEAAKDGENGKDEGKVLVSVNGEELTEAVARDYLMQRMPPNTQLGEDQMRMLMGRYLPAVTSEFVGHVLLKEEAKKQGIEVADEEIDKLMDRYRENPPPGKTFEQALADRGMTVEQMREKVRAELAIPKLLEAELGQDFEPTEEEVETYFNENKERFARKETVRARHILLKVPGDASAEEKAKKKEEMVELRKQLVEGAEFAELAKTHSDCPSKDRGGDLGVFGRGRMVKPFEEAAFNQKVMEIGDVIETNFGYHIVQVTEHNEPGPAELEEVRPRIVQTRTRQKRNRMTQ
jgi:peptidyl-prolyl cis-trans isomerase C